jgi:formylglycine-generating enzyme required for sulfatase activity
MIDAGLHPLAEGRPPVWASGWGHDRFGVHTDLTVGNVIQRLRWIPPGRFLMGSPADESGRFDEEGPRPEVTIAEGYWLFDTPCTQALWEAVMEGNPSRFRTPTRPVESVRFADAVDFIVLLNARIPGLDLTLPSEAQWEYACRAGTTTATYAGAMDILGENNAPVLDGIAWYSGNSGVGFDLDTGEESTGWPQKQHPHDRAGTRPVGLKAPNPWGLHDMLGNVWEWCADHWHENYNGAPSDGSAWLDRKAGAAGRVMRGGSWRYFARNVRAACRHRLEPTYRSDYLGFRCARVQGASVLALAERGSVRGKQAARSDAAAATRRRRGPKR